MNAGIPAADKLSPHSLRHTAITEILDATGGDLRRAQDFAGHADPRTTRRYDRARHQLDSHACGARKVDYYAACAYSLINPSRTGRRSTSAAAVNSATSERGSGGRWPSERWGRCSL
jgi:hypothetical protein